MPPVGVLGIHEPLSKVRDSPQVVAGGCDCCGGGVTIDCVADLTELDEGTGLLELPADVVAGGPDGAIVVGGFSPHAGQNVAVDVIVVVEMVDVTIVTLPLVDVTGQVVTVVTTISVVTRLELAGVVAGVLGTQTEPEDDSFSLQLVVAATELVAGEVIPPVGVLRTQVPLSKVSVSPQVEVVVTLADEVELVSGTHDPLLNVSDRAHWVVVAAEVVADLVTENALLEVFGTQVPLSRVSASAQVVVRAVVVPGAVVLGVVA